MNDNQSKIRQFAEYLKKANNIFVVTGAGLSAESGLPTYRGVGGLYNDTNTEHGMPIEKALSGPVFHDQPEITWKYLAEVEAGARGATFNRGHQVLAEMETHFDSIWILTQNVDGFHTAAGSTNVIEIHGNLHRMKCISCRYIKTYEDYSKFQIPPICPECSSPVRPDVVLFEELLPSKEITRLQECQSMDFDLVISIGTGSHFPYILQPVMMAKQFGVPTVEINPSDTTLSEVVDLRLPMKAGEALEGAWTMLAG